MLFLGTTSTDSSTNASKDRPRVHRACDRCRTRKIKCSGTQPCTTCTRLDKECSYGIKFVQTSKNDSSGFKVGKSNTFNPSSTIQTHAKAPNHHCKESSAYTRYLENRVDYLELLILFDLNSKGDNEDDDSDTFTYSSTKWRLHRRPQNVLTVELCNSIYQQLSSHSRSLVSIPRAQYFGWNMSGVKYLTRQELPPIPKVEILVDKQAYIDFYFKEVNPLFAILHESMFREQIRTFEEEIGAGHLDMNDEKVANQNHNRLMYAIMFLVIAISIRYTEFQKPDGPDINLLELEEKLFKYASEVVRILSFEWESFELIQSLLLMTFYLRVTHRQSSCFATLGQAITMTKGMGLNYYKIHSQGRKPYESLKAKRLLWAVYVFDRLIGLQSGRHFSIRDEEITVPAPSLDFETEKDDWLTFPAFSLIHMANLAGYIQTFRPTSLSNEKVVFILEKMKEIECILKEQSISEDELVSDNFSLLVKSQTLMHLFDLKVCLYGRTLFRLLNKPVNSYGLAFDPLVKSCESIIKVIAKLKELSLLFVPCYLNLLLLYNSGIYCLVMINAGLYMNRCTELFRLLVGYTEDLCNPLSEEKYGKPTDRFTMAKECLWALKMTNRFVTLRLKESLKNLEVVGVDHGPAVANRERFTIIGLSEANDQNKSSKNSLSKDQHDPSISDFGGQQNDYEVYPEESIDLSDNVLIGNLQWFDKFLDFDFQQ